MSNGKISGKNTLSASAHGAPGSLNTQDIPDPKTALLFRSCAGVSLRRTFAVQLRVLARILGHDEENHIRGLYGPGKNVIVPFSLNSPDFGYTGIFGLFKIAI